MLDPLSIAGLTISIFDQLLKLGERTCKLIADAKTFDDVSRLPRPLMPLHVSQKPGLSRASTATYAECLLICTLLCLGYRCPLRQTQGREQSLTAAKTFTFRKLPNIRRQSAL